MTSRWMIGFGIGVALVGTLCAQLPFREFPGVEYRVGDIPLPSDYRDHTEFTFSRLMYPPSAGGRYGGFGGGRGFGRFGNRGPWQDGNAIWTQDYPRADRHFLLALRRLTRLSARSVEQPVNFDEGGEYDFPWLYAVQAGHLDLTDAQVKAMREYLLRGGFFMADDFWGPGEWDIFTENMRKVFPDRQIVELSNTDGILHSVYDLSDRYQVASMGSVNAGRSWKCEGCPDHWRAIFDDKGRVMVAITFQSDIGDSWEWADEPAYPAHYAELGIRIGVNYIVYAMTH